MSLTTTLEYNEMLMAVIVEFSNIAAPASKRIQTCGERWSDWGTAFELYMFISRLISCGTNISLFDDRCLQRTVYWVGDYLPL